MAQTLHFRLDRFGRHGKSIYFIYIPSLGSYTPRRGLVLPRRHPISLTSIEQSLAEDRNHWLRKSVSTLSALSISIWRSVEIRL